MSQKIFYLHILYLCIICLSHWKCDVIQLFRFSLEESEFNMHVVLCSFFMFLLRWHNIYYYYWCIIINVILWWFTMIKSDFWNLLLVLRWSPWQYHGFEVKHLTLPNCIYRVIEIFRFVTFIKGFKTRFPGLFVSVTWISNFL